MKWLIGLLIFLSAIGAAGLYGLKWQKERDYKHKWEPIVMPQRVARVLQPLSVDKLAELLQQSGKIRDTGAFLQAAKEIKLVRVAAGGYALPKIAGPRELAKVFKQAPDYHKVTFPEGWTGFKMATRLAQRGFAHAADLRKLVYPPGKAVSPWEGRLFPDTYDLPGHGDAKTLLEALNGRFKEVMKGLPVSRSQMPRGGDGKPLSQDQIVTLASLVERETSEDAERPIIAGVLLNRLKKKMRLQCDASVQYVRELQEAQGKLEQGHKEKLLIKDLWLDSPYNTYRHAGLPPGPICNPGKSSIMAAMQPRASKYLFYVMSTKLEHHRFAATFPEHLHNKELAAQESGR